MFISTKTVIIHGHQWHWKTMYWVLLCCDFLNKWKIPKWLEYIPVSSPRIYWNVDIFQNWERVVCPIPSMDFLDTLEFNKKPWVVIFDEMWLNFNSKDHWTEKNKALSRFFFVVRKYNLSSIFISQRWDSVPIDMRQLADLIYKLEIIYRPKQHPLFRITRQTCNQEWILEFYDEYIFDIISYLQMHKVSYDTLQTSIIDK